jgi:VIT1/CCC1 family predicted Fe2+/Mn2+ transporter
MKTIELLQAQRNEITEYHIYTRLAAKAEGKNKKILSEIARDEKKHYEIIKKYTKQDVAPKQFWIRWYIFLAGCFGLVFALRLMERGEHAAQVNYKRATQKDVAAIFKDEHKHEQQLIGILKDERVTYAGAIVLGLNDALVELTGALAGMTFIVGNTQTIALIGFITGFAASLSMAASGYLSSREEEGTGLDPFKGAIYTGVAYILVVLILILPYILINNPLTALATMLTCSVVIIASYTRYISIAKQVPFRRRFSEMAIISLGVAFLSFAIGYLLRATLGV